MRFFFVLSGFVLTLPFLGENRPLYSVYALRRICRIYLPYLVSLGLALIAIQTFAGYPLPGFSGAVTNTWFEAPRAPLVWQHIAMIGLYAGDRYNEVYWSLIQEMRISLVFPVIALLVRRTRWWIPLLVVGMNELMVLLLVVICPRVDLGLQSPIMCLHISGIFVIGAMLAKYHRSFCYTGQLDVRPWRAILIGGSAFLMYSMGVKVLSGAQFQSRIIVPMAGWFPDSSPFNLRFITFGFGLIADWVAVMCSLVAIYFAIEIVSVNKMLNHSLFTSLGQASYSLYLVHTIVLYSLLYGLLNTRYLPFLVVFYVIVVSVVTLVFYRLVEIPAVILGKKIGRVLN